MPHQVRRPSLQKLERAIKYHFKDRDLFLRALTHRSFANEQGAKGVLHNEALEFLGDAVLGFLISSWLIEKFPGLSEGKLSKIKAHLVSASNLVAYSESVLLGDYLRLNRGEEKTGGRKKQALLVDAFEALLAAIYLDGGITAADEYVRRVFCDQIGDLDPEHPGLSDYKSALQELLQSRGIPGPEYVLVETAGPDHHRTFRVEVRVGGKRSGTGEGKAIKRAQQEAAKVALRQLQERFASDDSSG